MGRLEQRIEKIEATSVQVARKFFRIVCAGETPSASEQAQIDEALSRGEFVIIRTIVRHNEGVRS